MRATRASSWGRSIALGLTLAAVGCHSRQTPEQLADWQMRLRNQCFGAVTNECTSKNIDFDIAVMRSYDYEQLSPFTDARTRQAFETVFGLEGWTLYKQSVDETRDLLVRHMESLRPSFLARWLQREEHPDSDGVRAFYGPEDLGLMQVQIKKTFIAKLKAIDWHPTTEQSKAAASIGARSGPATGVIPGHEGRVARSPMDARRVSDGSPTPRPD